MMPRPVAIALLALSACTNGVNGPTGGETEPPPSARPAAAEPGVRLFTFVQAQAKPGQPVPTFHQVALTGILSARNRCLILDSGERSFALVFREGTASSDSERGRLTVEGRDFALGSRVSLGGSGGSAVGSLPQGDPKAQCQADDSWFVVPGSFKPAG